MDLIRYIIRGTPQGGTILTREKDLVKRIRNGDNTAWNELIMMYYPDILRYCLWRAPDQNIAEDAVQETFLKAIRYFDHYVSVGKFRAFLYKIAANTCKDLYRKKSITDVSMEEIQEEFSYMEYGYQKVESDMQIRSSVSGLSEELREVVLLRFGQELTLKEIADITNLPLRTIQSRLRRALKQVKENCTEGG